MNIIAIIAIFILLYIVYLYYFKQLYKNIRFMLNSMYIDNGSVVFKSATNGRGLNIFHNICTHAFTYSINK